MNLFNEAIYKNHLEHTAAGTKWGKHKYLYITPSGRYVYPEDVQNGKSAQQFRSRQMNDQIKSAHSNATSSKMELTPGSELKKRAEARAAAKTSGVAAGSKSVASNAANRNTVTIKSEEKKTESATSTSTEDKGKYKNMSEETKAWLEKEAAKGEKKEGETKKGSGKKGGSGKKKGSSSSSKKSASSKTQEANKMGLSDDDLKNMEVNTDATNRDEVLKNIALRVIRGDYGNGADRKAKLGNYYDEVQKRVNELTKSGEINREGPSSQNKASSSSTDSKKKEQKVEKTETQKRNAEEIRIAKELSDVTGMKNSATLNLIKMYNQDSKSKKFKEELSDLAEGDEKQKQRMLRILGYMKHENLEEGLFLKHWGIKRRSGRYKFGSGDRPYQHESGHTRKNSTFRSRRSMSNEDLDAAIIRARKEVELYRAERDNRSQGQRFVEDVLTSIGKDVLRTAGKGALLWAGKNYATKVLKNEELGDFIARGGPKKEKNK